MLIQPMPWLHFSMNMEIAFLLDNQGKISLDYARNYNVGGLVELINGSVIIEMQNENTSR